MIIWVEQIGHGSVFKGSPYPVWQVKSIPVGTAGRQNRLKSISITESWAYDIMHVWDLQGLH